MTVRNQTDRYVWLTRYWSYQTDPGWHIEGTNCIAPHDEITEAITYSFRFNGPQAKLRAEIKGLGARSCDSPTDGDIEGNKCNLTFSNSVRVIRAEAFVKDNGTDWTLPTSCKV